MKYGMVYYNETANLGDDIQSYAAIRFLPKIDYIIDREKMSSFVPDQNELVTIIMNGWFAHDKTSMPPSPFINPLIISAHFTDNLLNKKPVYFDNYFLKFLKSNEPIGLRDHLVKKYLDEENIKNYFSGCLTLTIEPFKNIKKEDRICLVDIDKELEEVIKKTATDNEIVIETHYLNSNTNKLLSFEKRMKNVEEKLKFYQSCKLVITTRLHVALPCIALKVPVLLIYNEENKDVKNRLSDYIGILNYTSKEEFIKCPKYNFENKIDYLKIKKDIEKKIKKFLDDSKNKAISKTEDRDKYYKYFVEQKEHIDKINNDNEKYNLARINEYERLYKRLYMNYELYKKEENIRKENFYRLIGIVEENENLKNELSSIKNSKGYRLLEYLRKIKRKILRFGR